MNNHEIVIIGSGPSGISAALPLLKKDLFVTMLDSGIEKNKTYFSESINKRNFNSKNKWDNLVGKNYVGLKDMSQYSPKLRMANPNETPSYNSNFNQIKINDFLATGSLSTGGLSNFWGAVSPKFSKQEFNCSDMAYKELEISYENIAKRIGISGTNDINDKMAEINGYLSNIQKPLRISSNAEFLLNNYKLQNINNDFFLGLNRSAVLTKKLNERLSCNYCESCMSNCKSGSIYNSFFELSNLKLNPKFKFKSNSHVIKITKFKDNYKIIYRDKSDSKIKFICSKYIFLAAGTINSTKFALSILEKFDTTFKINTTPMISMGLFIPKMIFKKKDEKQFGLGQLSFSFRRSDKKNVYGLLYDGTSFAKSDLANQFPLSRKVNLAICDAFCSSLKIGLIYLDSKYTNNKLYITNENDLSVHVTGVYKKEIINEFKRIRKEAYLNFKKLGAFLVPGTFKMSQPGSDVHYASTLPMGVYTAENGELLGAKGIYLVDGSLLKEIPAKNLTFTVMANADRIARNFDCNI